MDQIKIKKLKVPPQADAPLAQKRICRAQAYSMFEMPHASKHQCDIILVRCFDNLFVAHRATGLDHCRCPGTHCFKESVCKGEECVRCDGRSLQVKSGLS